MNGASFYVIVIGVAMLVMWRRTRSMVRPIRGQGARLLIPVLFLIPALMAVLNPQVHAPAWEWETAVLAGLVLSVPLIWTTDYEVRADGHIYAKRSIGFILAFIVVFAVRFMLRNELTMLDSQTKTALFICAAIAYIVPWRVVSFLKFRKIYRERSTVPAANA